MSPAHRMALTYAVKYGWAVIPLSGKIPFKATNGWKDGSTDPEKISAMFGEHPNANVGIVAGKRSNLTVIDIDYRSGGFGTMYQLLGGEANIVTPQVCSGDRGRHLYCTYVDQKLPKVAGPGVDIISDGKYVVAPPSTHPNGRPYTWSSYDHFMALNRMPQKLLNCLLKGLSASEPVVHRPVATAAPMDKIVAALGSREDRRGEWWSTCPVHEETKPSFSVNFNLGVCHCFGCGFGGSVGVLTHVLTDKGVLA